MLMTEKDNDGTITMQSEVTPLHSSVCNGCDRLWISLYRIELGGRSFYAVLSEDGESGETSAELLGMERGIAETVYRRLLRYGVFPALLRETVFDQLESFQEETAFAP